jgi:hypothetical protein
LELILEKYVEKVLTWFVLLRIGTTGELL